MTDAAGGMIQAITSKALPSRWVRAIIRVVSIRGASWAVFCLSLLVTAIVCQEELRRQQASQWVRFEADAAVFRNAMLERLHGYACFLQGGSGLFAASVSVEPDEFGAYVAGLELARQNPGILAFGYAERVAHKDLEEFLQKPTRATDQAGPPFQIWPAGERPEYLVVRFVEPLDANRVILGFDLGSEPARRAAAMKACDTGLATLSAKLELVEPGGGSGLILLRPIYHPATESATPAQRRERLKGWIYMAFLSSDLMADVRLISRSALDYEIFDGNPAAAGNLLCRSGGGQSSGTPRTGLSQTSVLDVYGRSWTIRQFAADDAVFGNPNLTVGLVASGGVCISLLVFGVVHLMATTGRRAFTLATSMTAELRHQKDALRESEQRLAMVIEGSNDGIWDWDLTTNEVYFSPRWKSMLGYQEHELDNTMAAWDALLHPEDRETSREVMKSYLEGSLSSCQREHRLRHKDGNYRWILARGVMSRDSQGRPVRMVGSHVDLTELKQAEQSLRRTNAELLLSREQLQSTLTELSSSHEELKKTQLELIQAAKLESVGTLAAGMAHEVKNPLQTIVMGLDFLEQQHPAADEVTRVTLVDMRDAALRADSITRELLQFSTATEFTPELADLEEVLERTLWLTKTDLTKFRATVVKHLAGALPPVAIDVPKIQQVLINLILNAVQAMGAGGTLTLTTASGKLGQFMPRVRSAYSSLKADDEVVVLRLNDSGPGIPEHLLPRIFDPFFTTKAVGSGTGLGLSVVKRIIDLHGALIVIHNATGGGLEVELAFAAANVQSPPNKPTP